MKRIKKVAAGTLLTLSGFFLLLAVYQPFNDYAKPDEKLSNALAYLVAGLPLAGAGGWIAWRLQQQAKKQKRDRLQSTFYRLLKKGNAQLTLLGFAMEADLSAEAAKQYLDQKAREFNATFDVCDGGGVVYVFHELSSLPPSKPGVSPSVSISSDYWTLGSTKDDVLRVQGTPTHIKLWSDHEDFHYGRSKVVFKKGRVAAYDNDDKNLKVVVKPSS
ncbi:MAG TPA: hypothetical protein V6D11_15890 [Waterburya sp.]|jgi:large subunit ribosomal protein L7/L12